MATEPFCSHLHTHNAVKHGNLEEVEWMILLSFVTSPQPDGGDSELLQHFLILSSHCVWQEQGGHGP